MAIPPDAGFDDPEHTPPVTAESGETIDPADMGWIEEILAPFQALLNDPEAFEKVAQAILATNLQLDLGEMQYKQDYLKYLDDQLGLKGQELDLAKQQLEFQQGEYWDFYTGPYMQFLKDDTENKAQISGEQVTQSRNQSMSSYYNMRGQELQLQALQAQLAAQQGGLPRAGNTQGVSTRPREYAHGGERDPAGVLRASLASRGGNPLMGRGF